MKQPGVSVCIPVFTDSLLARYAIETVYDVADEVLVWRDGPQEDAYWPQFQAFASRHAKVRIVEGKIHLGYMVKDALLREARHQIIHFLDTDELLNENYLNLYAEALRFTEQEKCITVLPVRDLHGDVDHVCEDDLLGYDASHSLAYWTPQLRWDNQTPADKLEHIYGTRLFLFPSCIEVPGSEYLEREFDEKLAFDPLIVHLCRVKSNRLIACRAVAYDYQEEKPGCTIDEYVVRRAGAGSDAPRGPLYEKLACAWLNERWGKGIPVGPEIGPMPAMLDRLRPVVRCEWRDGFLVRRDDSGWDPERH